MTCNCMNSNESRVLHTYRTKKSNDLSLTEWFVKRSQCKCNLIYLNGHAFHMPHTNTHSLWSFFVSDLSVIFYSSLGWSQYLGTFFLSNLLNHMNHDLCRDYLYTRQSPKFLNISSYVFVLTNNTSTQSISNCCSLHVSYIYFFSVCSSCVHFHCAQQINAFLYTSMV